MASIMKRADRPTKPWVVVYREPGSKKQRYKAFKLKHKAEAFRDTVSTEVRQGTYVDRTPLPFTPYAEDWLLRTKQTVTENAHAQHEWAVGHLTAAFNLTPIQNLEPLMLEHWQATLLEPPTNGEKGLGPRSVEILRNTLGTMLEDAKDKGFLFRNPLTKVRRFKVPERELHYLEVASVKALCGLVGAFYGVLFLVLSFCGLRIGEAIGLKITDIDFEGRRLFIQRQAIWRRKKDCPEGEPRWKLKSPKTEHGTRVVEIPTPMVLLLRAHLTSLTGPNPLGLVFPSEVGTPLYPKNVRRRHFLPAMRALAIDKVRMHDLRRTFIAIHVEAGTHPKLIQERGPQPDRGHDGHLRQAGGQDAARRRGDGKARRDGDQGDRRGDLREDRLSPREIQHPKAPASGPSTREAGNRETTSPESRRGMLI